MMINVWIIWLHKMGSAFKRISNEMNQAFWTESWIVYRKEFANKKGGLVGI